MAKRARRGTRGGRPAKAPKRGRETHAQRLARTRKAIERFERHLVRGGEGPVRVTRHVDRMLSFGVEHLVEQMGTTPMDVDADKVGLYMGVWFPYQFQREPVKEVGVMLDTLERWFRFLHRDGLYRQGDLRAVLEVLGRKRLYEERFDSYLVLLNAGPPTEGPLTEWTEAFDGAAGGPLEVDSLVVEDLEAVAMPPPEVADVLEAHGVADLPVLADLRAVVRRVGGAGVRLTDANRWLPRRELRALNGAREAPEPMTAGSEQTDLPVLNALVLAARAIGALQEDDRRILGPGPARAALLELPPERQYWALANAIWNLVPWRDTVSGGWGILPDMAQRSRGELANHLLSLEGTVPLPASVDVAPVLVGPVAGNVLRVLAALGIVEAVEPPVQRRGTFMLWPRVTALGEAVLPVLGPDTMAVPRTRRARDGETVLLLRAWVMSRPDVWREFEVLAGQTLEDVDAVLRRALPVPTGAPSAFLAGDGVRGDPAILGGRAKVDGGLDVELGSLGLEEGDILGYGFSTTSPTRLNVALLHTGPAPKGGHRYPRLEDRNIPRFWHCEDCLEDGRIARLYCVDCDAMVCEDCAEDHDGDGLTEVLY